LTLKKCQKLQKKHRQKLILLCGFSFQLTFCPQNAREKMKKTAHATGKKTPKTGQSAFFRWT
jgi:hypothetical protein